MLQRQGDVFIQRVDKLPRAVRSKPLPHGTLVHGEITGHSHRLECLQSAQLFAGSDPGEIFIDVTVPSTRVVHEEHGPIELKQGCYRVWRQREYTPEAIRYVYD